MSSDIAGCVSARSSLIRVALAHINREANQGEVVDRGGLTGSGDGFLGRAELESSKFREEGKRGRKSKREEKGERKGGRKRREKRSPEAEREGVTTAALSITIFTTRRNLRDLNILCGGLAQALHNHLRESVPLAVPRLYNYARGWDSVSVRRVCMRDAHVCRT